MTVARWSSRATVLSRLQSVGISIGRTWLSCSLRQEPLLHIVSLHCIKKKKTRGYRRPLEKPNKMLGVMYGIERHPIRGVWGGELLLGGGMPNNGPSCFMLQKAPAKAPAPMSQLARSIHWIGHGLYLYLCLSDALVWTSGKASVSYFHRMAFEDFCRYFSKATMCHLMNTSIFSFSKRWHLFKHNNEWKPGSSAGGCVTNQETFLQNPQVLDARRSPWKGGRKMILQSTY